MSEPYGSKSSIQREKRVAGLKNAERASQRTNATGKPLARACASAMRQLARAAAAPGTASARADEMYSCCKSTRTKVGMIDGSTYARRSMIEAPVAGARVTRLVSLQLEMAGSSAP